MKGWLLWLACLMTAAMSGGAQASASCPDSGFFTRGKVITDFCYTCVFPIVFAGLPVPAFGRGGNDVPDDASSFCVCPARSGFGVAPGFAFGWWVPSHVMETVRSPLCLPTLGLDLGRSLRAPAQGLMVSLQKGSNGHNGNVNGQVQDNAAHNFHWIKFPGSVLFDMAEGTWCAPKGGVDMDYGYFSEIDITHHSDLMAMYVAPETKIFANVFAQMATLVDAVATTFRKPIRQMIWSVGAWDSVYPITGKKSTQETIEAQMGTNARSVAKMHRYTLAKKKYGEGICADKRWYVLPKQAYQQQNMWPLPIRTNAQYYGKSALAFGGNFRKYPGAEERITFNWAFSECCITFW